MRQITRTARPINATAESVRSALFNLLETQMKYVLLIAALILFAAPLYASPLSLSAYLLVTTAERLCLLRAGYLFGIEK